MKPTKTLSSILWIGISTLLGGVISYLYHPVMLQHLSLETFGEFGSMVGLFNILGVLTTGVGLFLVKEISMTRGKSDQWSSIYYRGLPRGLMLGGAIFLIVAVLSPLLARYLRLSGGVWPLILVASSLIFSFGAIVLRSFAQGAEKFQFLARSSVLSSVVKLGIGRLLVRGGWGLYGAIGGFVGAGIFGLLLTRWYVRHYVVRGPRQESDDFLKQELSRQLPQMVPFLVLVLGLSLLMNSDIIIAKNIFDEMTAGGYAALSVIAKFVIFIGAAIETVYYPKITQHSSAHLVPTVRLRNASLLMIIMTIGAIIGSGLLGGWVLRMMKPELISHTPLLVRVVAMASGYVFVNFYAKILVAWHDRYTLWIIGGGRCLWVVFLYISGVDDVLTFVQSLLIIELIMSMVLWMRIKHHQSFSLSTD